METFELTQKILAIGNTYEVRQETRDDVMVTIRGKILSMTPSLTMKEKDDGPATASMKGNFLRTKFECFGADGKLIGTLTFPTLNRARCIVWFVVGTERRDAMRRLRAGDASIPASRVQRERATGFAASQAAPDD